MGRGKGKGSAAGSGAGSGSGRSGGGLRGGLRRLLGRGKSGAAGKGRGLLGRRKPAGGVAGSQGRRGWLPGLFTKSGREARAAAKAARKAGRKTAPTSPTPSQRARQVARGAATKPTKPSTPPKGGGSRNSGNTKGSSAMATYGPNPFTPLIEAADLVGTGYDPDRAKTVVTCMESMPEAIEALSRLWTTLGEKNTEQFIVDPGVAETWRALGTYFGQLHAPISEAVAIFRRVHETDLDRIENPREHAAKWDISINSD